MRFKKSDSRPHYPVTRQGMNSLFKLHPLECQVASFYFKPTLSVRPVPESTRQKPGSPSFSIISPGFELQQLARLNFGDSTGQAHFPQAYWSVVEIPPCGAAVSFKCYNVTAFLQCAKFCKPRIRIQDLGHKKRVHVQHNLDIPV